MATGCRRIALGRQRTGTATGAAMVIAPRQLLNGLMQAAAEGNVDLLQAPANREQRRRARQRGRIRGKVVASRMASSGSDSSCTFCLKCEGCTLAGDPVSMTPSAIERYASRSSLPAHGSGIGKQPCLIAHGVKVAVVEHHHRHIAKHAVVWG